MNNMDLSFSEMQEVQRELMEKYKDKWTPISPEIARDQLLWMIVEAGEAADIIKKVGDAEIMNNAEVRHHFVEELCDVLMYLSKITLCYSIEPDEIAKTFYEKHRRNMIRWE